jgi:hypothetical protein
MVPPLSHRSPNFLHMSRIYREISDLDVFIAGTSRRPTEALFVSATGLAQILRRELAELHERRRLTAGTPAEANVLHAIAYWQETLAWIRPLGERDLVLSGRSPTPVHEA